MIHISIAKQFSDTPWGRYPSDGNHCGQNFRDKWLVPSLHREDKVVVSLDGVEGIGSSFLDEAFGGLVRKAGFSEVELKQKLQIETEERPFKMYVELAWRHIREASNVHKLANA